MSSGLAIELADFGTKKRLIEEDHYQEEEEEEDERLLESVKDLLLPTDIRSSAEISDRLSPRISAQQSNNNQIEIDHATVDEYISKAQQKRLRCVK